MAKRKVDSGGTAVLEQPQGQAQGQVESQSQQPQPQPQSNHDRSQDRYRRHQQQPRTPEQITEDANRYRMPYGLYGGHPVASVAPKLLKAFLAQEERDSAVSGQPSPYETVVVTAKRFLEINGYKADADTDLEELPLAITDLLLARVRFMSDVEFTNFVEALALLRQSPNDAEVAGAVATLLDGPSGEIEATTSEVQSPQSNFKSSGGGHSEGDKPTTPAELTAAAEAKKQQATPVPLGAIPTTDPATVVDDEFDV